MKSYPGPAPEDKHEARADLKSVDHVIALVMHAATFSYQTQPARTLERFYFQPFDHLVAVYDPV